MALGANLGQQLQNPYGSGQGAIGQPTRLMQELQAGNFGGGGGFGAQQPSIQGGGAGQAQINYQAPQPFQQAPTFAPNQGQQGSGQLQQNLGQMAQYGQGLMEPGSDYFQQLLSQGRQQMGAGAAAQKRAAALAGAEQGFGAGASPEMLSMQQGIDEASRIGMGNMMGQMSLAAPQIGAGMLQSTFGPGMGLQQLGEQSRQFGAGLQEQSSQFGAQLGQQAQQFGANVGLQQQQLAAQQAQQQAQFDQQRMLQQQQLQTQMAMSYGGF